MFRELINYPIDPIPVEYINNINRPYSEPDYSLTCLCITFLKPRIEGYNGIYGGYYQVGHLLTAVNDFVERFKTTQAPAFYYYVYTTSDNENEVKTTLKENGFETKENIGTFLKTKANVDCTAVYHKEKNIAAIFINSRDMKFYHVCISFLSLLYPRIFNDKPMTEADYKIIKACSKTDKDAFVQRIQESLKPYTLEFRRMMLNSMLRTMHEAKINSALQQVNEQRRYVDNCQTTLAEAIKQLKSLSVVYEGMKATEEFDDAEEDFVEYLSTKDEIKAMSMNGTVLKFAVATLLNNYNSDAWETFSRRGAIYDGNYYDGNRNKITLLDVFNNKDNRKLLLDNIFCESPEFAIKIAGNYRINLESCRVMAERNYNYKEADPIFKSYMPNPHIKIFSCLGGYENKVSEQLRKRNYIGAIELCCASAGSVDLDETEQTFRPFIGWLMACREKILKRRDGVEMTPEEALIYLHDKEKTDETD